MCLKAGAAAGVEAAGCIWRDLMGMSRVGVPAAVGEAPLR